MPGHVVKSYRDFVVMFDQYKKKDCYTVCLKQGFYDSKTRELKKIIYHPGASYPSLDEAVKVMESLEV